MSVFAVKIEEGEEGRDGEVAVGPVYRNPLAGDDFPPLDPELMTTWNIFRFFLQLLCSWLERATTSKY